MVPETLVTIEIYNDVIEMYQILQELIDEPKACFFFFCFLDFRRGIILRIVIEWNLNTEMRKEIILIRVVSKHY